MSTGPFALYLLLAATCGVAACRSDSKTEASAPAAKPSELRWGIAIPARALNQFVNQFVSDSFVGIGWDGRPIDKVVVDPEWTPDQLGLKLRIRPNLQFHDGLPIDREYLRRALEAMLKAPQQRGTNISYQSVRAVENDPEAADRVIIKLSRPEAFLLADLANSTLAHPTNEQIGNGPYKVAVDVRKDPAGRIRQVLSRASEDRRARDREFQRPARARGPR